MRSESMAACRAVVGLALLTFSACSTMPVDVAMPVDAAIPEDADAIYLKSAELSGQTLSLTDPVIQVAPGESISGSITVEVHNGHHPGAIVPLAATPSWGEPETSYWAVVPHVGSGISTWTIPVDLTAPEEPGTYYIAAAIAGRYNYAQVMSCTHAGLVADWSDDNDVAEWSADQFEHAIEYGWVLARTEGPEPGQYFDQAMGATAVRIEVGPPNNYHPADYPGSDWRLAIDEVTAYAAAWKRGDTWPVPPNPIPMDYVTRAGYLWRNGECYSYDPSKDPPMCWDTAPCEQPEVTVTAPDDQASEVESAFYKGVFRISRTGETSSSLTVNFTMNGTADNGADYEEDRKGRPISSPVTVPAGSSFVQIVLKPIADALCEGREEAILTLSPGSGYEIGTPASATIMIADDPDDCRGAGAFE